MRTIDSPSRVVDAPAQPAATPRAPLAVEDLTDLLRSVQQVSQQLQSTHEQLQQEVSRLKQELAQANAQLRRSRTLAELGEMAAGIAHEVRNPLGSIQLYVQMLRDDLASQRPQADLCDKIGRAVSGIDAIVRDVLLFARETRVDRELVHVDDLLDHALSACENLLQSGGVQVRRQVDDQCRTFVADAGLLGQALANVIRNSLEAMADIPRDRRRLWIDVHRQMRRTPDGRRGQRLVIGVTDSGPGIDPAVIDRIFNPFFTTRKTGTGLGLAIVHRIVEAHGGQVSVANEPSGGARVELCLPPNLRRANWKRGNEETRKRRNAERFSVSTFSVSTVSMEQSA